MNRINNININKINSKGIKKMEEKTETITTAIKKCIAELYRRGSEEVREYGEFSPIYVQFTNPEKSLSATDFALKISKPPKTIEGHEIIRNLELVAYKLPSPYKVERILSTGTKKEVLDTLRSKEFFERLQNSLSSICESLNDMY